MFVFFYYYYFLTEKKAKPLNYVKKSDNQAFQVTYPTFQIYAREKIIGINKIK